MKHGITGSAECRASGEFVVAREAQNFPRGSSNVHGRFNETLSLISTLGYIHPVYIPPPLQPQPPLCHPPINALVLLVEMMASVCAKENYERGSSSVVRVAVNVRAMPALFLKVRFIR